MHQQKSKKILIYFFLLFLFSSINNISLSNLKFEGIKDIKVFGLDTNGNSTILKEIENLNLDNIFFINIKEISNKINSNNLVEKYEIFKRYPSSLNINIDKTEFLAKINNDGKIFLIGSNGKLSENKFSNKHLPFVFGKPKIDEFLDFKEIIENSKFIYSDIKNLYYFSSKRWDLELNNNIIIKLSKENVKQSLDLVFEFLYNKNFKDIKIVDARIKNQIILND
jgi:cell division protein FtsQ